MKFKDKTNGKELKLIVNGVEQTQLAKKIKLSDQNITINQAVREFLDKKETT